MKKIIAIFTAVLFVFTIAAATIAAEEKKAEVKEANKFKVKEANKFEVKETNKAEGKRGEKR